MFVISYNVIYIYIILKMKKIKNLKKIILFIYIYDVVDDKKGILNDERRPAKTEKFVVLKKFYIKNNYS